MGLGDVVWEMSEEGSRCGAEPEITALEALLDYIRRKQGVWFTTGEEIYEWYRAPGGG